jgi:moderate conductance mechanosensitive channel
MPDMTAQTNTLISWFQQYGIVLLIVGVVALLVFRGLRPWVHRVLVRVIHAQARAHDGESASLAEADRRVTTLETLLVRILRGLVILGVVAILLGVFDLWSMLTGLGLVLAALTLAGQSIILDYLMGILILVEGQYFNGDVVQVGTVEGTVEEVGLRRTVIRDVRGTLHSISNGTIRQSANLTRTYALAVVEIDGIADRDVETVIEVLNEVGADIAADPEYADRLLDTPAYSGTTRLSSAGATVRVSGRVRPDARVRVEQEIRRRVAAALAARGVELIRPGAWQPQARP